MQHLGATKKSHPNLPTLKFFVINVGHVNNRGNIIKIGICTFGQTFPSAICIFCISVASREYPSAHPHVSTRTSWISIDLIATSVCCTVTYSHLHPARIGSTETQIYVWRKHETKQTKNKGKNKQTGKNEKIILLKYYVYGVFLQKKKQEVGRKQAKGTRYLCY